MWTWPATVSLSAGPAPLYGLCVILAPVSDLNSSICRWPMPPTPELEKLYLPGAAFTAAMKLL